jgi:hypothetical protein
MAEAIGLKNMEPSLLSMSSISYKISSKFTNRFKVIKGFLCTHIRSLNVCYFGMVEATGLKVWF